MALNLASLASIAIEQISDTLPQLTETSDTLAAIFKDNGRAVAVGSPGPTAAGAFRVPMKYAEVGNAGIIDLNGGTLPTGGQPAWNHGTLTPIAWAVAVQWTLLAQLAGESSKLVVQNAVDETLASQTRMIKFWRDVAYHTDGTGTIGTVDAVDTVNNIVTMKSLPFGARFLREGQSVDLYNGTAKRSGSPYVIDRVYKRLGATQQFHYTGSDIGSAGQGDFIKFSGVTDGAPVWVYGLPYFINVSTAGSLLGITKSTADYVVSNGYDMAGAQISLPVLQLVKAQVKNRVGPEALKNQFWYTHQSQVAAYKELGFSVQMITSNGQFGDLDLLFKGKISIDGDPVVEGIHADQQSWYYLNPEDWGRATYGKPPFFIENPQGGKIFTPYDSSTGMPTTGMVSYLADAFQAYCMNVMTQAAITTCRVPAGHYDSAH